MSVTWMEWLCDESVERRWTAERRQIIERIAERASRDYERLVLKRLEKTLG